MQGNKSSNEPSRATRRLIEGLSEAGASVAVSALDPACVALLVEKGRITLTRGLLPLAAAADAESRGLAVWRGEGAHRRMTLTEAGAAYLRRLRAPAELDGFAAQHREIERRPLEADGEPLLINVGESPLLWLARRRDRDGRPFLESHQIEAGERYRRDLEQAQLLQRVTASWDAAAPSRRGAGAPAPLGDVAIDARRRLCRASDAVGPELAGLLTDVCGYLKGLELAERERSWPARSGKIVLRIALDRLARHYGLAAAARGPAQAKGLRHWGEADYRPNA